MHKILKNAITKEYITEKLNRNSDYSLMKTRTNALSKNFKKKKQN